MPTFYSVFLKGTTLWDCLFFVQFFRDFGTCPDINSLEKSRIHQKPRGKITVVITTCPKIVSCCLKTLFISNLLLSLVTALL